MLSARTLAAKPALTGVRLASVRPSLAIRRPVAVKAGKVPEIDAEELKLKASEWASDASAVLKVRYQALIGRAGCQRGGSAIARSVGTAKLAPNRRRPGPHAFSAASSSPARPPTHLPIAGEVGEDRGQARR